jgi:hypothetical protein
MTGIENRVIFVEGALDQRYDPAEIDITIYPQTILPNGDRADCEPEDDPDFYMVVALKVIPGSNGNPYSNLAVGEYDTEGDCWIAARRLADLFGVPRAHIGYEWG